MRKETFETLFDGDKNLLCKYILVGTYIKCNGDLFKAIDEANEAIDLLWELYITIKCETSLENIVSRLPPNCEYFYIADWTVNQIVSFAANREVEVVESSEPSDEGLELIDYEGVWSVVEDGEDLYTDGSLVGRKRTRVLRILPA